MIDTYMDRCDAAAGTWRTDRDQAVQSLYDDPRYFNGSLYNTMIDRNVAEARYELARFIATRCMQEKEAMARRVAPFTLDFGRQLPSFNLRIREAFSTDWLMTLTDCRTRSTSMTFNLRRGLYVIEIRVAFFHWQTLTVDTRRTGYLKVNLVPCDA